MSKPDNDPLYCSSYYTIALPNRDFKIVTKMIFTRLTKVLHYLISPDSTCIEHSHTSSLVLNCFYWRSPGVSGPEEGYDSTDWIYIKHVLAHMGFSLLFLKRIFILYDHSVPALRINGQVSIAYPVSRGTK